VSKILLVADAHIHPHKNSDERLKDCIKALDWVFETAHAHNIDNICFLGDLFHSRQKIGVSVYQWTFEVFSKWMQNKKSWPNVYLLVGNHDMVHKFTTDVCSIKPLNVIDGVVVVDKPVVLQIDEHSVAFLPYTENPLESLGILKDAPKDLLLGHIALDGAILNSLHQTHSEVVVEHDGDMTVVDADVFKDWKQVFLGHYHGEQKVRANVEYVGSPLQLSFGETKQDKHLIIYDLDTHEKEYVINDFSPKHFIISQEDIGKFDLTNNFVRIIVDDISSAELIEFRNDVLSKNVGSLDIRQKPKKEEDGEAVDVALAAVLQNDLVIEKYVEYKDEFDELNGLDKVELLSIGNKIIETATNQINQ